MPHLQDSNLAAAAQASEPKSNEENVRHQSQIGQDLWKQMKRVSILIFSGDKTKYESWKAAFMS